MKEIIEKEMKIEMKVVKEKEKKIEMKETD